MKPVNIYDSTGNPQGTSANPLRNDPTGTTVQPVSGTVTANVGTGTRPISVVDGGDVAQGASTDNSSSPTVMGRLLKLIALFPTSLGQKLSAASLAVVIASDQSSIPTAATIQGTPTVTANAGTGNFNAKQVNQSSLTATLCSALTTTGAQTGQSLDGYDGAGTLQITAVGAVAAQAVSLQIEGSIDNSNWERIAIAQIGAVDNPVYSTANFTLTPGNGTISHLYAVRDTVKFVRVNATANNLGTGLTVTYYSNPV